MQSNELPVIVLLSMEISANLLGLRAFRASFLWTGLLSGSVLRSPVPGRCFGRILEIADPSGLGHAGADGAVGAVFSGAGIDAGLPDVVLPAPPPYLFVAAQGHVPGAQAAVQGGVPFLRQAGLPRCQVVEAGQDFAPGAVGTARALLLRPGIGGCLPAVALFAQPPYLFMAGGGDGPRVQFSVFVAVPLPRHFGVQGHQVGLAGDGLPARAVGTAAAVQGHGKHRGLPAMAPGAPPPYFVLAARSHLRGRQGGVFLHVPLCRDLRQAGGQVCLAGEGLQPAAIGAAALRQHHAADAGLPGVALFAQPPGLGPAAGGDLRRCQRAVFLRVPELCPVGIPGGQVRFPGTYQLGGAIGAAMALDHPDLGRSLPCMAPGTPPPDLLPGMQPQSRRGQGIPLPVPLVSQLLIFQKILPQRHPRHLPSLGKYHIMLIM